MRTRPVEGMSLTAKDRAYVALTALIANDSPPLQRQGGKAGSVGHEGCEVKPAPRQMAWQIDADHCRELRPCPLGKHGEKGTTVACRADAQGSPLIPFSFISIF